MGDEPNIKLQVIKKSKYLNTNYDKTESFTKDQDNIMLSKDINHITIKSKGNSLILNGSREEKIELKIENVSPRNQKKKKSKMVEAEVLDKIPTENNRKDGFGIAIVRGKGKKHRVTFIDELKKKNIQEIIFIESFKDLYQDTIVNDTKKINCCGRCVIY